MTLKTIKPETNSQVNYSPENFPPYLSQTSYLIYIK